MIDTVLYQDSPAFWAGEFGAVSVLIDTDARTFRVFISPAYATSADYAALTAILSRFGVVQVHESYIDQGGSVFVLLSHF